MKVIVYTTKTCSYCKQVMKWLTMKNKDYTLVDVTEDATTRQMLYDKTGYTTVPITQIGDKFIVGPNWAKLAEALV